MVLTVSFAMAQNTATTTQNGPNNDVSVTQTGSNTAEVDQTYSGSNAVGNSATVDQTGTNFADVDQNDDNEAGTTKGFAASITQIGQGVPTGTYQNQATIDQLNGKGSGATIEQTGTDNEATIVQGKNTGLGTVDGVDAISVGQTATIDQEGTGHDAMLKQTGARSTGKYGRIIQRGSDQTAVMHNGGAANKGQTATIEQYDASNFAYLYQNNGNNGVATILQDGVNNLALSKAYARNFSSIKQVGTNVAFVNQDMVPGHGPDKIDNTANIEQYGTNGTGTYVEGTPLIVNRGGHDAQIANATVYIMQDGSKNTGNIFQGTNLIDVYNNGAGINQNGDDNTATTTQLTDNNTAYLTQNGASNSSVILQEVGNTNVVNLTQSEGADADIWQSGTSNTVMGLDLDPMASSLNGSTLDVDQFGTGNTLHLQQTNGASATVMQDGMTNTSVVIQN